MQEQKQKEKSFFSKMELLLIVIGVLVILIVSLAYVIKFQGAVSNDINDWADLGTYFSGLLSPFIAFLALIAIVFTLKHSREALQISKKEFKATRKELKQSRRAQEKLLEKQGLEFKINSINKMYENVYVLLQKEYSIAHSKRSLDNILKHKYYNCCTQGAWNEIKFDLFTYASNLLCISHSLREYLRLSGPDQIYAYYKSQLGKDLTLCKGMFEGILESFSPQGITQEEIRPLFQEFIDLLKEALESIGEND